MGITHEALRTIAGISDQDVDRTNKNFVQGLSCFLVSPVPSVSLPQGFWTGGPVIGIGLTRETFIDVVSDGRQYPGSLVSSHNDLRPALGPRRGCGICDGIWISTRNATHKKVSYLSIVS